MGSIKRHIENLRAKLAGVSRDLAEKEKKRKDVIRTIPPDGMEWTNWGADAPEWKAFMKKEDIRRLSGLAPSRPSLEEAAEAAIKDAAETVKARDQEVKRLSKLLDAIEHWNITADEADAKVLIAEADIEALLSGKTRADEAASMWMNEMRQSRMVEARRHHDILRQAIRIVEDSIKTLRGDA